MKIIAILFNLIFLGGIAYSLIVSGGSNWDLTSILLAMFFIALPMINLYIIFQSKMNDWFSLFLKRKALEEKKKIEKLQD